MAYHLSVVDIIHEINQQDTPPSPKLRTPEMSITPGQSFGGLFVLYTLLNHPDAFRRYLAVSHSLWWDGKALLDAAGNATPNLFHSSPFVYMCAGELENQNRFQMQIKTLPEMIRQLLPREMTDVDMHGDMFTMQKILNKFSADGLRVEAYIYPEETHESIMGAALSRGLRRLYGNL